MKDSIQYVIACILKSQLEALECVTVEIRFTSGKFYEQQNTGRGHKNLALPLNVCVKQYIRLK